MNILDLFKSATALSAVFKLGYLPKREEFYELTPEQYEKYYETERMEEEGEKIYMLLPNDIQKYNELAAGDVFVVSEKDLHYLENVDKIIDSYCEDRTFETFEDKLYYVATIVPGVFSEGTKFAKTRLIYLDKKVKK
jgi:hypothetical protein